MVSRSNILLLLQEDEYQKIDEQEVLLYFDRIKNLPTASENPFFWLQYGITAINISEFELAHNCFENAYANADKYQDFDTYQLDTHKTRLLLTSELHNNTNNKEHALDVFKKANNMLYNNRNKKEKIWYALRQVIIYDEYFKTYKPIFDDSDQEEFRRVALKMDERFNEYFNIISKGEMQGEVGKAYRSYYRLFEKTPYRVNLNKTVELYNFKISTMRDRINIS